MTEAEFSAGWKLLLLQPWAYRYRSQNEFGEPSADTKGQQAFYFENFKHVAAEEWFRICKEYAKGKEWPSIDTLKRSLSSVHHKSYQQSLDPAGGPLLWPDEFGLDLFDAIRLQTGLMIQLKNVAFYTERKLPGLAKHAQAQADELQKQLVEIFSRDTIAADDLRRVLAIGSEVASGT